MESLDTKTIKMVVRQLRKLMNEQCDHLLELDRAIGDGDLGLTMAKAFDAADEAASRSDEPLPGKLLARLGMTMAKAAPSTMGTLLATGFMRGGKAVGETPAMDTKHLAQFFRAFVDGIIERGKTKLGNKTVVDALHPAAESLEKSARSGSSLKTALEVAAKAADDGRKAAKNMKSQHGKAAVFRDQTIGLEDPGAYVGALIIKGFAESLT